MPPRTAAPTHHRPHAPPPSRTCTQLFHPPVADQLTQWEGLVFILVGVHMVALFFWAWLLYKVSARVDGWGWVGGRPGGGLGAGERGRGRRGGARGARSRRGGGQEGGGRCAFRSRIKVHVEGGRVSRGRWVAVFPATRGFVRHYRESTNRRVLHQPPGTAPTAAYCADRPAGQEREEVGGWQGAAAPGRRWRRGVDVKRPLAGGSEGGCHGAGGGEGVGGWS